MRTLIKDIWEAVWPALLGAFCGLSVAAIVVCGILRRG